MAIHTDIPNSREDSFQEYKRMYTLFLHALRTGDKSGFYAAEKEVESFLDNNPNTKVPFYKHGQGWLSIIEKYEENPDGCKELADDLFNQLESDNTMSNLDLDYDFIKESEQVADEEPSEVNEAKQRADETFKKAMEEEEEEYGTESKEKKNNDEENEKKRKEKRDKYFKIGGGIAGTVIVGAALYIGAKALFGKDEDVIIIDDD